MNFQLAPRSPHGRRRVFYKGPRVTAPLLQPVIDHQTEYDEPVLTKYDELAAQLGTHEASHAIISLVLNQPLHRVWIAPERGCGCCVGAEASPASARVEGFEEVCKKMRTRGISRDTREWVPSEMIILASGKIGQNLFAGTDVDWAGKSDNKKIELLATLLSDDASDQRNLIEQQKRRAEELVRQFWNPIAATAARLVEKLELLGAEVRAIYQIHL
jgi:hypothetical protein